MGYDNHGTKGYLIRVEDDYVLIRVDCELTLTPEAIISMLGELYALKAYRSDKKAGLWDFRGCQNEIDFNGMQKVSEYVGANYDPDWSHQFTALVVDEDVLYGLSRMYDNLTEHVPTEVKIFRSFEKAKKWIREQVL